MQQDSILIVDDSEVNRAILVKIFEGSYRMLEAADGEEAINMLRKAGSDIAAVLLDLIMPVMDGYQTLDAMRQAGWLDRIPVLIITSDKSTEASIKTFDMGALDVITKPFEPHIVQRRTQNLIELNQHKLYLEDLVEKQRRKIQKANDAVVSSLASIIEARNVETGEHVQRIKSYLRIILEQICREFAIVDFPREDIELIVRAAALHDIGKIAIPDAILCKPARLTKEEFDVMKTHTTKGCEMVRSLSNVVDDSYLGYAYEICRHHHERWDGKGYPNGLKGEKIPLYSQAAGIVDCFDALTNDRVYKKAIEPEIALKMIIDGECGTFNPRLLNTLDHVRDRMIEKAEDFAINPKEINVD